MHTNKTSRRQFVQLTGGLALCLRHGLLPQDPVILPSARRRHSMTHPYGSTGTRTSMRECRAWPQSVPTPMTSSGPADYLLRADGHHIAEFPLQHQARDSVDGANGPGARLTLSGTSPEGIEKTIAATLYQRYPGFAVYRVSYRNVSTEAISLQWLDQRRLSGARCARRIRHRRTRVLVLFGRFVRGSPRLGAAGQAWVRTRQLPRHGGLRLWRRHADRRCVASGRWPCGGPCGDNSQARLAARGGAARERTGCRLLSAETRTACRRQLSNTGDFRRRHTAATISQP